MLETPSEFHHLKLLFRLSSQTSQTKETVIRIENVVSGQMVSTLLQKFQPGIDPLLTANDEDRLLSETTTNVIIETFDESDVVSPNSESLIYEKVKDMLVSSRTVISKQDDKLWDSVLWNEDNYRPDKSSKLLNDVYKTQNIETQRKMTEAFKNTNKAELSLGKLGLTVGTSIDLSHENSKTKEDLDKLYQESKDHVQWDGEKFVPKPLSLSKINLGNLRDKQSHQESRVKVSYSTAVLSTPIHFTQISNETDEWIELLSTVTTLKKELEDLKRKHEQDLKTAATRLSNAIASCNNNAVKSTEQVQEVQEHCKMRPNCHWEGAGPFCNNGDWCPPGYNHICKDGWGDTNVYCWTGYKALCCK